jgi:2-polyprenyl-3-methyl-5-hydroxy-6-metoxy-1,4-benzoquinol methylase
MSTGQPISFVFELRQCLSGTDLNVRLEKAENRQGAKTSEEVMNDNELQRRIGSFPRWHYQFDLCGHLTPIFDPAHVNRHRQRDYYFFRPLVDLCGGSLAGKRVLDLGCNAGFWSLRAIESECAFVLGIDGRQMHIDQANLVFGAKGVAESRYDFRCANLFDTMSRDIGSFDIVLCLGLLYHVSKPMTLLEWISRINTDLLVIDTSLSTRDGSLLELRRESLEEPRSACDYELVMYPTKAAVGDMVRQFGYETVCLKPRFSDYTGAEDFRTDRRRAFLCSKRTRLERLEREPMRSGSENPD